MRRDAHRCGTPPFVKNISGMFPLQCCEIIHWSSQLESTALGGTALPDGVSFFTYTEFKNEHGNSVVQLASTSVKELISYFVFSVWCDQRSLFRWIILGSFSESSSKFFRQIQKTWVMNVPWFQMRCCFLDGLPGSICAIFRVFFYTPGLLIVLGFKWCMYC
jgi:hypothetical protein